MNVTFRAMPAWPYPERPRRFAQYRVGYDRTLRDLEREIKLLDGSDVVVGVVGNTREVRRDGMLRSDARLAYEGIEVSFSVPDGRRLVFHTDVHRGGATSWQDNLRAIVLGLEALRAVERYGITEGIGQQYAGFAQLESGGPSIDRGKRLVEQAGSIREALRRHHPDNGGQQGDFIDVQAYRQAAGL